MKITKIQLLSPFNTGSNLLGKILKKNIKEKVKINVQGHTLFWKHTISKLMIEEYIKSNTDTLFICLYKPIHNWICSMKKASYNIKWNNTLTEKCHFKKKRHNGILYIGENYNNIIEIYNKYYNMYMELINTHKRVISMNYYDIIDRKNVENYISNKLFAYGLSIKNNNNIFSILDKPSKKHGNSVSSSNDAIKKRDDCYHNINSCEKSRLAIKEHFNSKIKKFFEGIL